MALKSILARSIALLIAVTLAGCSTAPSLVQSIQIPAGLQIFPNPASDRVFLRVAYPQKGRMTIEVLDSYGSTRKITRVQKVNSGSLETPLSLYGLSNGVYFLRVTINGWSGLTRVIKL